MSKMDELEADLEFSFEVDAETPRLQAREGSDSAAQSA
jgi:hypothetical protein